MGGFCYHVFNRGNLRAQVFHDDLEYELFARLLISDSAPVSMRVVGYCLMPNHFHLVVWPRRDGDLTAWMNHLMNRHVKAYKRRWSSVGHIWQGRFKAFPIEQDHHLLTVLRYVERNPVAASLVGRAEQWRWSSAYLRAVGRSSELCVSPVELPSDWLNQISGDAPDGVRDQLARHTHLQVPFGSSAWTKSIASQTRLSARIGGPGRPPSR